MRSFFRTLLYLVSTLLACAAVASCGTDDTGDSLNDPVIIAPTDDRVLPDVDTTGVVDPADSSSPVGSPADLSDLSGFEAAAADAIGLGTLDIGEDDPLTVALPVPVDLTRMRSVLDDDQSIYKLLAVTNGTWQDEPRPADCTVLGTTYGEAGLASVPDLTEQIRTQLDFDPQSADVFAAVAKDFGDVLRACGGGSSVSERRDLAWSWSVASRYLSETGLITG